MLTLAPGAWCAAAAAPVASSLSIEDCVRVALQLPARQAAAAAYQEAWADRARSARAGRGPNVKARAGASFAPLAGYDPALTDGGDLDARIGVEQPLYDGGRARGEAVLADAGAGQARADQAVSDADLALEVRLAFVDRWEFVERARVLSQALSSLNAEYETSERLVRGGTAMRSDVLRLGAQVESERAELAAVGSAVNAARTRLAAAMGVDPDSLLAVEDSLRLAPLPALAEGAQAVDVVQAAQLTRAAEAEQAARHADRAPRIALEGDAGSWTSVQRWRESGFDAGLGFQAGVTFEMPIWDGGALAGQQSAAAAEVRARRSLQAMALRHAASAGQAERAARDAAAARAQGLRKAEEWAAQAVDLVHTRWAGGAASGIEVLEAHRARTEFALARVEAEAEAARAHARALRALGGSS